jgi:hypothetical protein
MSRKAIAPAPAPVATHPARPSSITLTRASHAEILTRLARNWFEGKLPQLVNDIPVLEYLSSLQWDRSIFPGTDLPSKIGCAASPAQVNEVALTLRARIVESL